MKAIPQSLDNIGWNRRVLTLDDFYELCERENITVIEYAIPDDFGYYFEPAPRARAIALDSRLDTFNRALVGFHEFAHAAWHTPGHYADLHIIDAQADVIAHCAVLPRPLLFTYSTEQLMSDFDYPRWLITQRRKVYERLRI